MSDNRPQLLLATVVYPIRCIVAKFCCSSRFGPIVLFEAPHMETGEHE